MTYKLLIKNKLSEFYMFSELQPEQIEKLANDTKLLKHHRGEFLFNRGDQAQGFYILLEGQIKLGVISPQGGEKILGLVQPGQSFGEAVLFLERSFPVSAHATIDSEVLLVDKDAIFEILDNDTTVARRMLAGISSRNRQHMNDIESISLQTRAQR